MIHYPPVRKPNILKPRTASKCETCSIGAEVGGFCSLLTQTQLAALSGKARKSTLKRGEAMCNQDLLIWPILAVSSGVLSLQHLLEDGRKTIAALFMPGDIIDMRDLASRNRGQLISLGKTDLCHLSPAAFESAISDNSEARRGAWNNLRTQTYRAMDHASDLAKKQALEKLASFIFECVNRQSPQAPKDRVHIPVRRIDLADYLGMQPETVSRGFKDLEARRIIAFNGISDLNILDIPTLRRIANGDKQTENLRNTNDNSFKHSNKRHGKQHGKQPSNAVDHA